MIKYFLRNQNFGLQNELVVLGHFILIGVIRNKTASLLPSPGAASPPRGIYVSYLLVDTNDPSVTTPPQKFFISILISLQSERDERGGSFKPRKEI